MLNGSFAKELSRSGSIHTRQNFAQGKLGGVVQATSLNSANPAQRKI